MKISNLLSLLSARLRTSKVTSSIRWNTPATGCGAINEQTPDSSPDAIDRAARHALMIGRGHRQKLQTWLGSGLNSLSILELGPGPDFGSVAYLACYGAKPHVADRWLPKWHPEFHPAVYRRMADILALEEPEADISILEELAAAGKHGTKLLPTFHSAEHLEDVPDLSMDAVVSNAVFEHIADASAAARAIARVTKHGGISLHQVDLRDHRDFNSPLEFLLLSQKELENWLIQTQTHAGHPRRRSAYESAFAAAGFETVFVEVNGWVDETYLAEFKTRLEAAKDSVWHESSGSDLTDVGVCFVLRKPTL